MRSNQKSSAANKAAIMFMVLCTVVYFTSYITRKNYDAVIQAIINDMGVLKEQAGLVSTAAFFTYGVGQLISGFIGDKVRPRLLIVIGMTVTAVCNIIMPMMSSAVPMMVLWGINGFAQAMFWPPMVRMMANNLDERNYNRACIWVSVGASAATILIYLLAAMCTEFFTWHMLFYISAAFAVVTAIIWQLYAPKKDLIERVPAVRSNSSESPAKPVSMGKVVILMMIPILCAIALQGILRDGVTTWFPTLIAETFTFPDSLSILLGMILPAFSIISYNIAAKLENKIKNELVTSTALFIIATASSGLLAIFYNISPLVSVFLLAILTGCMHGINLMLISRVPRHFDRYGKISTISGIVNASTYVGSALATYIIPLIAAAWSWQMTIISWAAIAAAGSVLCLITVEPWTAFKKQK